ncbi:hypothetical protein CLM73_19290 [Achromobacter spanius]|uniref:DUF2628 domain-containing protein n=2 Tax=Achromobacter spanius TaxID=217203 RepID=A0A2S0IAL4_9BURK|nr:hypothetical protein CLM73_19290 [Achromobacter spanius]
MQNPKTGEIKQVKVGWSWTIFLFSGMFGIPLFLRGLHVWGAVFLAVGAINLIMPEPTEEVQAIAVLIHAAIYLGLQLYMSIKGNELTAKNYLEKNWTFVDPESEDTALAKQRWGITTA